MSKACQTILNKSKTLIHRSAYIQAMYGECADFVLDEQDCLQFKGHWRKQALFAPLKAKLDLEIGPGAGHFLEWVSLKHKDRYFLAIELKYKPLIQSARRIKKQNIGNAKLIRYNARLLENVFSEGELNNVYIHFPDPWPKKRHHKHRLIKASFLETLYRLQAEKSFLEIKTDHKAYFEEICEVFKLSPYKNLIYSNNLHGENVLKQQNFVTSFERIFIQKSQPIYYLKCTK